MKDEFLYDTNVLCYAYDLSEPTKRKTCMTLVHKIFAGEEKGIVSNQILVELYNALTRKLDVKADMAKVIVESFVASTNWLKISYSHITVRTALNTSKVFKTPFLDTLIAETMKENGISQIVTENEKDFARIPGIRVINPLVP